MNTKKRNTKTKTTKAKEVIKPNRNVVILHSDQFKQVFAKGEVGTPKIEETFGKQDWIGFGVNNDYPNTLIDVFQNADGLHAALIKRKADMIGGLGWQENPALDSFIKNEYSKEDLNEVAYKVAYDIVLFGGYYLNVVWDVEGKSIAKISRIPYEKVRCQKPYREDGEVSNYYISRDWTKVKNANCKAEYKPYLIPVFDSSDTKDALENRINQPSQLLFVRLFECGMDFYTLSPYHSNLGWLKTSIEISNYHYKSAINSYMPNLIVSVPTLPLPEEQQDEANKIKARSGAETAGETVVLFADGKDNLPSFQLLQPSTADQKYKDVNDIINEKIYTSHNANNIIAGISVSGKLGSSSEISDAYKFFQKTVIAPMQKQIEKTFNKLAAINGLPMDMKLNNYLTYLLEDENTPVQPTTSGSTGTPITEQPK
jgi:hypothetical protein